ncbi:MAG TPA: site-specific integrase [Solirubrobacteraceae bacterium]|jgi:integrase|nr:site-specific integrase [Solirubrobacteraceae bacterium]
MHAQISERPTRRKVRADATEPEASAQILQFPTRSADDPDAATALARVVQALSKQQSLILGREIGVLSRAIAQQIAEAEPIDAPEGLRPRHSEKCALKRNGGACNCNPPWEAWVWSTFDKKKIRKTLSTKQAAIKWRRKHLGLAESGQLRAPARITLAETAYSWLEKAQSGEILNRSGRHYKPSMLRTLETDFRLRLIPELGMHVMSDIERADMQARVAVWQAALSPSKVHGCINAARVLWRDFDLVTGSDNRLLTDPTKGLRLPAVPVGGRDRIATADEAHRLIAALKVEDRTLWATALYTGMRHGELRALRAEKIELALKRIKVHAGWDQYEGEIDTKTEKGRRTTVVIQQLEMLLVEHLERTGRTGRDLVFGKDADTPYNANTVHNRARKAWKVARAQEDEEGTIPEHERIRPIGLHECRHTAVSHMLDAGITIDKVSKFIGHASITVTIDRYGHLLPGGEAEAAAVLDEYHARRRQRRTPVPA